MSSAEQIFVLFIFLWLPFFCGICSIFVRASAHLLFVCLLFLFVYQVLKDR